MAVRFVAVGDLMVDVLAHGTGHDAEIRLQVGGSAYNSAVWASALGADATVVGRLGDDAPGRMVLSELERGGIAVAVSVDPDEPTGAFLTIDDTIRARRGANATFAPEHLPRIEADAVLVSGYLPKPTVEAALGAAEARWVALDAARLTELPPGGNVLLANEETAAALGFDAEEPPSPPYEFAVVTRGQKGAVASMASRMFRGVPPRTVDGNPIGVGDAFAAALLVSLARGDGGDQAIANALAAGTDCAEGKWPE